MASHPPNVVTTVVPAFAMNSSWGIVARLGGWPAYRWGRATVCSPIRTARHLGRLLAEHLGEVRAPRRFCSTRMVSVASWAVDSQAQMPQLAPEAYALMARSGTIATWPQPPRFHDVKRCESARAGESTAAFRQSQTGAAGTEKRDAFNILDQHERTVGPFTRS